jgi:hypothetical protein
MTKRLLQSANENLTRGIIRKTCSRRERYLLQSLSFHTVLRQNLIHVENGLIPRWNDLNMTRELNQKSSLIACILCSSTRLTGPPPTSI